MKKFVFAAIVLSVSMINAFAEEPSATPTATSVITANATPASDAAAKYPLSVCPISGETVGDMGDPVVKVYEGREVKFCCNKCVKTFEKDVTASLKSLDEKIVAAGQESYPMKTCVVSGEKLGEMGKPYTYVYKNRLVEFCCGNCVKTFTANPEKYLAMIDAAAAGQATPATEEAPKAPESQEKTN